MKRALVHSPPFYRAGEFVLAETKDSFYPSEIISKIRTPLGRTRLVLRDREYVFNATTVTDKILFPELTVARWVSVFLFLLAGFPVILICPDCPLSIGAALLPAFAIAWTYLDLEGGGSAFFPMLVLGAGALLASWLMPAMLWVWPFGFVLYVIFRIPAIERLAAPRKSFRWLAALLFFPLFTGGILFSVRAEQKIEKAPLRIAESISTFDLQWKQIDETDFFFSPYALFRFLPAPAWLYAQKGDSVSLLYHTEKPQSCETIEKQMAFWMLTQGYNFTKKKKDSPATVYHYQNRASRNEFLVCVPVSDKGIYFLVLTVSRD